MAKPSQAPKQELTGQSGTPGEGPYMIIRLVCADGIVQSAWFETYGCPWAMRCGDWITTWAVGRDPATLAVIESKDLQLMIGGMPLGKEFCATLTIEALLRAIKPVLVD